MKKHSGFTLIELIIVIVIIGILATVAVPRFLNQTRNARIAALNGLAGAVSTAVSLSTAEYQAEATFSPTITMSGFPVIVSTGSNGGLPTGAADGIGAAMKTVTNFSVSYGATTQWDFFTPVANCNVQYSASSGAVTVNSSGC